MSLSNYVLELPFVNWDKDKIMEFIDTHDDDEYKKVFVSNSWSIMLTESSPEIEELIKPFEDSGIQWDLERSFIVEVEPNSTETIVIGTRSASYNFAMSNNASSVYHRFEEKIGVPMIDEEEVVEDYYFNDKPVFFNTLVTHTLHNPTDSPFLFLSLSVKLNDTWDHLKQVVESKTV